jgi:hypothetical protein
MGDISPGGPEPPPSRRWYQFSLGKLFLVTTLVAMLGSGWAALSQVSGPAAWSLPRLMAIVLLVLAGPPAALIGASLFRSALQWFRSRP